MTNKIKIGISRCLLGQAVRFDGGHKKDNYVTQLLANYFALEGTCPEVESGLPIPRPTIRLVGDANSPTLVEVLKPEIDHTDRLTDFSAGKVKELDHLSGFILKSKSPTCGMERVKVYQEAPKQPLLGQGLFARALLSRYPLMPVEEEGRLNDYGLRENFIERIFVYHRWRTLICEGVTAKALLALHSAHKLTLLAHNQATYRELGKELADLKNTNMNDFASSYICRFMDAMKKIATRKNHTNVLMHIQGYFKDFIDAGDKEDLRETIESYRLGLLPLIVPLTLLKHHLRKFPDDYLLKQHYLFPYPEEMMLRNHI
jgi:uncharacterized protein YbgA (DUF1722 family)/uncharacterized protein YbbK (DUF523 family)